MDCVISKTLTLMSIPALIEGITQSFPVDGLLFKDICVLPGCGTR